MAAPEWQVMDEQHDLLSLTKPHQSLGLGGRAHFLAETYAHSRRQRGEGLEPVSDARLNQMLRQSYAELEVASVALLPTVVMVMCS